MGKREPVDAPDLGRRQFLGSSAMVGLALACTDGSTAGAAVVAGSDGPRREMSFDGDWCFIRADIPGAESPIHDLASWSYVTLPHDWSIEDLPQAPPTTAPWVAPAATWNEQPMEKADIFASASVPPSVPGGPPLRVGPFDALASAGAGNAGWVVGGTAWYRKSFRTPTLRSGERVALRFDGSFHSTEVWLNGLKLGSNVYGYSAFTFDVTEHLRTGGGNVLAVRVRNEGETSRWYSGSGLYRHLWLTVTGPVRVAPWGIHVQTPRIEPNLANTVVAVEIDNSLATEKLVDVTVVVRDSSGVIVATRNERVTVGARGSAKSVVDLEVRAPTLWTPEQPTLYEVEVHLAANGRAMDRTKTRFGIRSIAASAERGLTINGKPIKLKGACVHADNGILGAAAIDRAEFRKVEVLKGYGYNAVRMGHQMASPAFLDACDEIGMLVIDEVFDVWEREKLKNDYSRFFPDNWKNALSCMVRQHRNHPSVIFWSIGNEIPEAAEPRGVEIAAQLRKTVLELDSSRLITAAIVPPFGAKGEPARRSLDVAGYNYGQDHYEEDHKNYPSVVMMGTEQFARDMHDGWRKAETHPWVLGEFIWSGIDYLGEVGSGSSELRKTGVPPPKAEYVIYLWDYPAYLSGCGEIDINGKRKPQGLYRDVLWNRSALELLVQRPTPAGTYERVSDWGWHDELESWTWPQSDGQSMTVRIYTSGDRVNLDLNGRNIAERVIAPQDKLKAEFEVPYAPGTLTAVAYRNGVEIARKSLESVGPPTKLRLRAERTRISATLNDLGYVFVEVCDAQDRRVPDAMVPITFSATGAARLRATGSANPRGLKSFRNPECTTFHGEALAIIQPEGGAGKCVIRATALGLAAAEAEVTTIASDWRQPQRSQERETTG